MQAQIYINIQDDESGTLEVGLMDLIKRQLAAVGIYGVVRHNGEEAAKVSELLKADLTFDMTTQTLLEEELKQLSKKGVRHDLLGKVVIPTTCDGQEQKAFEAFIKNEELPPDQHPMFYLFTDPKTNAAREAWKAAITWMGERIAARLAAAQKDAQHRQRDVMPKEERLKAAQQEDQEGAALEARLEAEQFSGMKSTIEAMRFDRVNPDGEKHRTVLATDGLGRPVTATAFPYAAVTGKGEITKMIDGEDLPLGTILFNISDAHPLPNGKKEERASLRMLVADPAPDTPLDKSFVDALALSAATSVIGEKTILKEKEALPLATHRHYKGGLYRLLGTGLHTETQEQLAVYAHLYPHPVALYIRPLTMFLGLNEAGQVRFAPLKTVALAGGVPDLSNASPQAVAEMNANNPNLAQYAAPTLAEQINQLGLTLTYEDHPTYAAGVAAFGEGKKLSDNPHLDQLNSPPQLAWACGWTDAKNQQPEASAKANGDGGLPRELPKEHQEGQLAYRAYRAGGPVAINPYMPEEGDAHALWNRGYHFAEMVERMKKEQ